MQLVRRLLSLLLACLVLMWAGAASAQDACDSAFELADQGQVEHLSQLVFDGDGGDPQDCPGIVSVFAQPSRLLLEVRPTPVLPAFSPILPHLSAPATGLTDTLRGWLFGCIPPDRAGLCRAPPSAVQPARRRRPGAERFQ